MTSSAFPFVVGALILGLTHGLAVKCKCDCQGTELTCGKELKSNALQTFKNPCQMICQNCVASEKWIPVKSGECEKLSRSKRRPPPPSPSAPSSSPTLTKLLNSIKQSSSSSAVTPKPPVSPPKPLSSLVTKTVPTQRKSPNTPPPPELQHQKAPIIGG